MCLCPGVRVQVNAVGLHTSHGCYNQAWPLGHMSYKEMGQRIKFPPESALTSAMSRGKLEGHML